MTHSSSSNLDHKIEVLTDQIGRLTEGITEMRDEMRQGFAEMRQGFTEMRTEMSQGFAEMRQGAAEFREEMQRGAAEFRADLAEIKATIREQSEISKRQAETAERLSRIVENLLQRPI